MKWKKSQLKCGARSGTWSSKHNQLLNKKETVLLGNLRGEWCPRWCGRGRRLSMQPGVIPCPWPSIHVSSGCPPSLGSHRQLDMNLHYISFWVFKESLTFLLLWETCASSLCTSGALLKHIQKTSVWELLLLVVAAEVSLFLRHSPRGGRCPGRSQVLGVMTASISLTAG